MRKDEFKKAAEKAKGMSVNAFYEAILNERPDLRERVAHGEIKPRFPSSGNSAYTVIVGPEVFKTAQYNGWAPTGITTEDLILGIERERNLLGYLTGKGLPVPKLTYVGKEFSFFGMERLEGEELTRYDIDQLPEQDRQNIAKQLATLSADLSKAVPANDAKQLGLDAAPAEWKFDREQLYAEFSKPEMRKAFGDQYEFFRQALEGHLEYHRENNAHNKQYLMHSDLKDGNLFWDRASKNLTGLLDFGLTHLTTMEAGFKKLAEKYSTDFVDRVLEEFSNIEGVRLTRKELQLWAAAEYVAYAIGELKAGKSPAALRNYSEFVRGPLQLNKAEFKTKPASKPQPQFQNQSLAF